MSDSLLETIENLSRFQLEHEKFYAQQPREQAVALQRHSRALCALADRWARVDATPLNAENPYEGPKTSTPQKQFSSTGSCSWKAKGSRPKSRESRRICAS